MNEDADMRAVVVHRPGPAESMCVERIPRPRPAIGELLVAVEAVGVNPVDASNRDDPEWAGIDAPYVVGYEFAGSVAETGQPVWGFCRSAARAGARMPSSSRSTSRLSASGRRR